MFIQKKGYASYWFLIYVFTFSCQNFCLNMRISTFHKRKKKKPPTWLILTCDRFLVGRTSGRIQLHFRKEHWNSSFDHEDKSACWVCNIIKIVIQRQLLSTVAVKRAWKVCLSMVVINTLEVNFSQPCHFFCLKNKCLCTLCYLYLNAFCMC